MSSVLHKYVHTRFRVAFGQPQNTLGPDEHWSFRSSPSALPINVLVNGTLETPAIWVFDSHDRDNGVLTAAITRESQVDDLIMQIQERVQCAASRPARPTPDQKGLNPTGGDIFLGLRVEPPGLPVI